jgi:hypothetical protein
MFQIQNPALPLAVAAAITCSASAQTPPAESQLMLVWSSRDRALEEQHEFAPAPETELSLLQVGSRLFRPAAYRSSLMVCNPASYYGAARR